ncbi:MAG: glycosyltransferase family 4 protein [Nitrospinae bacterium]|nr:glycosyltransferase family 4 protein [Nitrospinota bacterium]
MKASFVIPFYGADIGGGAETQCRRLAENLLIRGMEVEVLTTTLRDLGSHWNNIYYEPGVYNVNGVTVRRFNPRFVDTDVFVPINHKIIKREPITPEEELDFMNNAINSDAMFQFIGDNHKDRLYFFLPYLFGTSLKGTSIVPYKSFLIPCLHDEGYAYMDVTRKMFKRVNAALFNSRAEMNLALKIYGGMQSSEAVLMGEGVDDIDGADGARFRKKYELGDTPFLLYAGRKDATKNTPLLIEYFAEYKKLNPKSDLKLVLIGSGAVPIPEEVRASVHDLGFVPIGDKRDAYAAATAFCNPSVMESFSLVMMESWLCGRPAIVHSGCEATSEHALESGAGLTFGNAGEFCEAVDFIVGNPDKASQMGIKGRRYAKENYNWNVICGRFKKFFAACEEALR